MAQNKYLEQLKVTSRELAKICKKAVNNKDKWPSLKNQLQEEIKKQDYFFKLERIMDDSE